MAATVHGWIKRLMEVGENGEQGVPQPSPASFFFSAQEPMEEDEYGKGRMVNSVGF
jgi:hypothetical protein